MVMVSFGELLMRVKFIFTGTAEEEIQFGETGSNGHEVNNSHFMTYFVTTLSERPLDSNLTWSCETLFCILLDATSHGVPLIRGKMYTCTVQVSRCSV